MMDNEEAVQESGGLEGRDLLPEMHGGGPSDAEGAIVSRETARLLRTIGGLRIEGMPTGHELATGSGNTNGRTWLEGGMVEAWIRSDAAMIGPDAVRSAIQGSAVKAAPIIEQACSRILAEGGIPAIIVHVEVVPVE